MGILSFGMIITYSLTLQELDKHKMLNACLRKENNQLKAAEDTIKEKQRLDTVIAVKKEQVTTISLETPILSTAFAEIEKAIVPGATLLSTNIDKQKIIITGITSDQTTVAYILSNLRKSKYFKKISLVSTQKTYYQDEFIFNIEIFWEAPIKWN